MDALRQTTSVTAVEGELIVVSEILLEPEAMMVTSVMHGATLVRRNHAPLSLAVIEDYRARGRDALVACLQSSHLRFVRRLLSGGERSAPSTNRQLPLGVVATMLLGQHGEVLNAAGEDEIPSAWLRGVYLLSAMCDAAERDFSLGELAHASAQGGTLRAVLHRNQTRTAVCFAVTNEGSASEAELERHLKDMACSTGSTS